MHNAHLFIHIGTHKTGSTALRHNLRDNAKAMLKEGIAYLPTPKPFRQLPSCTELENDVIEQCRKMLIRDVRRKRGASRFILTWEEFSGTAQTGYNNTRILAQCLREITKDFEVTIVVYLRRQDDFIESLYTQMIHEGKCYSFNEFVDSLNPDSFNWARLLESYADWFGKEHIVARKYGKEYLPKKCSLIKDFAEIVGSESLAASEAIVSSNQGYSRDALEIARLVAPILDKAEKKQLRKILQQCGSKLPFENYSFWEADERNNVLAQYAESNAAVARQYFNDSSGSLFHAPQMDASLQAYQGVSLESAIVILTQAFLVQDQQLRRSFFLKLERKARSIANKIRSG